MKYLGLIVLFTLSAQASALRLFCGTSETPATCGTKIVSAIIRQGCNVDPGQIKCDFSADQNGKPSTSPFCEVGSNNCANPQPGNFGGDNCYNAKAVKIPKSEGVHNGYWYGIAGDFSRVICRE